MSVHFSNSQTRNIFAIAVFLDGTDEKNFYAGKFVRQNGSGKTGQIFSSLFEFRPQIIILKCFSYKDNKYVISGQPGYTVLLLYQYGPWSMPQMYCSPVGLLYSPYSPPVCLEVPTFADRCPHVPPTTREILVAKGGTMWARINQ